MSDEIPQHQVGLGHPQPVRVTLPSHAAIRRAAYLECAEIAERKATKWGVHAESLKHGSQAKAFALGRRNEAVDLAARYRQMAEGSGG